jgi:hypothetical protein
MLGAGSMDDISNALEESTRVQVIDTHCGGFSRRRLSCVPTHFFHHALLVKFNFVEDLVDDFYAGYNPTRIVLVIQNPFELVAKEISNHNIGSSDLEIINFFDYWVSELGKYKSISNHVSLVLSSNVTSFESITAIYEMVPHEIVSAPIFRQCFERNVAQHNSPDLSYTMSDELRIKLCAKAKPYWRDSWKNC